MKKGVIIGIILFVLIIGIVSVYIFQKGGIKTSINEEQGKISQIQQFNVEEYGNYSIFAEIGNELINRLG